MDASSSPLRFTIEIFSANFLTPGRYFLILRIVGNKVNASTLKLYVGNSKEALDDHEFTTDACLEDGDPETLATFTDSVISFWIPPGKFMVFKDKMSCIILIHRWFSWKSSILRLICNLKMSNVLLVSNCYNYYCVNTVLQITVMSC